MSIEGADRIREIAKAFGGFVGLAGAIDAPVTTVHGWARKGRIPPWRVDAIAEAAEKRGLPIDLSPRAHAHEAA